MVEVFQRYISIDWAGAGTENQPADLAVVEASGEYVRIVHPPRYPRVGRWTRAECREWLAAALRPGQPRTLVAVDLGFGLPWGADRAVFGCSGWHAMLSAIAALYERHGTAREAARALNMEPRFGGHGPYRFNLKADG
jgi:hypothetical protein